jgi:hypothetical protein
VQHSRAGSGTSYDVDACFIPRVLSVERYAGKSRVTRYMPGYWERHLIELVKVAA